MSDHRRFVSVIGTSTPDEKTYQEALELGRLLARQGLTVICGGRGGVMEAVCRGAAEEGGYSIGLLPYGIEEANPWVTYPIVTGVGEARNMSVAYTGEVVVAVGGAYGTLSEIGFALRAQKPLIALHSWKVTDERGVPAPVIEVDTPEEAAAEVARLLTKGGQ